MSQRSSLARTQDRHRRDRHYRHEVAVCVVAIKKKDIEAVKEQAKAYTANRDEIGELRERSAAVSRREQRADQREQLLDNKANELARQQQQLQQMYQRQLNLNQLLEKSEQDGRAKDKQIADLQTENAL